MKYDFDRIIERRGTNSEKWDVSDGELPMWVADMDFATAPEIIDALKKRVDHGIFGYSGIPDEWYEAYISWWKDRHQFTINREWLVFTTGVIPGISSVIRKLTTPAEKVLVQTPVYNIFFNSIINNGRQVTESPLVLKGDRYEMDFEQLERDLSDPQTSLMLLCNPQNPGGRIWTREELIRVAELCARYDVRVVSDEIHCDITAPGTSYVPFAGVSDTARDISVTFISPSKAFNIAGLHSAAVFAANKKIRHMVWRGLNTDEVAEPNAFAITATVAAFSKGGEWLDALNCYIDKNKKLATDYINTRIKGIRPLQGNATYLLWIDIRDLPENGAGFGEFLREKTGLILSSGEIYGQAGKGFLRMNLACPESVLEDGLARLKTGAELFGK
ncbi:MAG: pyridoxal phosphate-dependent aminotransferase [Lachnospiraceae bacterium]|nr:pyridoxal phosphate-dependent aminotransferase [Lachnospiraceae bacterium]